MVGKNKSQAGYETVSDKWLQGQHAASLLSTVLLVGTTVLHRLLLLFFFNHIF
jgi:hypothetical protein